MRDNSGRLILLALALLLLSAVGIWFVLGGWPRGASERESSPWFGNAPVQATIANPASIGFGQNGLSQLPLAGAPRLAALISAMDGQSTYLAGTRSPEPGRSILFAMRLDAAGNPDPRYGQSGRTDLDFGVGDQVATGAVLDSAGRLLVFGHADAGADRRNMVVARLDAAGFPDPTFDGDGLAAVRFDDRIQVASAGAIQPDGAIALAGYVEVEREGTLFRDLALARLRDDGSPDPGFGDGGRVRARMSLDSRWQEARALALGPHAELIAAGAVAPDPAALLSPLFFQFLPGGEPDNTFGRDGAARLLTEPGIVESIVVLKDGRIVAAGSDPATGQPTFIARLLPSGELDSSFGTAGVRRFASDLPASSGPRLHVAADGTILCLVLEAEGRAAILRLSPDGGSPPQLSILGMLDELPQGGSAIVSQIDGLGRLWVATSGDAAGPDNLKVGVYDLD